MLATTGCTHLQLEKDSVNQAYTVGDLEQQQVLNNLAMFVYNYNSTAVFLLSEPGGHDRHRSGTTPGASAGVGPADHDRRHRAIYAQALRRLSC